MRGTYLPTFSGCGRSRFGPALAVVVLALLAGSPAFAAQANGGSQGSGGNSNNGSQAIDSFPFGHESDSHVGVFAYYPDLVSWKNPDWWTNPDDAHMKPPIAQIFCDQLGEKRGWIVFYVHEWKPDYGKFPTDSSHPRWIELQSALAFAYQRLKLIPILRLHWLDNTGDPMPGWPPDWDIVPPGQHWSVPVDTETYDSLRGASPEDPGYQVESRRGAVV